MSAETHPFRRQLLVNTASSGFANVWAMAMTLVSVAVLLGSLGPAAFGTWVLVQTFSATNGWFSLADLGVVVATTRHVAEDAALDRRQATRRVVTSSLAVCALLGLVGAALLMVAGPRVFPTLFNTPDHLVGALRGCLAFFAAQTFFDLVLNSIEGSLEGLQRVDLSRAVDMLRRTLVVAGAAVAAVVWSGIVWVAAGSLIGTAIAAVVGWVVLRRVLPQPIVRISAADTTQLLRSGRGIALLRPLGVLQRSMDRVLVGLILGPASVTLVEIATQLQAGADAVLAATSYAVVPATAWLHARRDEDSLRRLAVDGTRLSLLVTMPAVTLGIVLAGPIVLAWVGSSYQDAAVLAQVALVNVALTATLSVGSQLLLGLGRSRAIMRAVVVGVSVNLALSVLLLQTIGIVGVFQATIIGTGFLLILLTRSLTTELGMPARVFFGSTLRPVLLPTMACAMASWPVVGLHLSVRTTLVAATLLGLVAYGATAYRWVLTERERALVRSRLVRTSSGSATEERRESPQPTS